MYWNDNKITFNANGGEININMRCIEMFVSAMTSALTALININMRCIEMQAQRILDNPLARININMRCIEIKYLGRYPGTAWD